MNLAKPSPSIARLTGSALAVLLCVSLQGCSASRSHPSATTATNAATTAASFGPAAVGEVTETFVDTAHGTPAWGGHPASATRTLSTTILYPTAGAPGAAPQNGATPDRSGAPYPLIVFSHGLGANPTLYLPLLQHWASAGFVVAAPLFPLTSSETPGGPDAGDVVNQPADVSAVITGVLDDSKRARGVLSGLVNANEIGVAGHSNGAVTTLGVVGNTCCIDHRVKAAVVMAGAMEGYPHGHYDFAHTPPLLLVHDISDGLIPYSDAIAVYNRDPGPKGLLSVSYDSASDTSGFLAHIASAGVVGPSGPAVLATTTDFFDSFLRKESGALQHIATDGASRYTSITTDWAGESHRKIAVPTTPPEHLVASVTPDTGLTSGVGVTVAWSGYTPGKVVNILQCSSVDVAAANSAGCTFSNAAILHPDPTGSGSVVIHVVEGKVGTGTCDASHACYIVVNDASSTDPSHSRVLSIHFAS